MQKDPNKVKALEAAIAQIEKNYGQGSIMKLGDTRHMQVESVDRFFQLDLALGVGGIPKGRIVEIYGPESSGKTTVALHMVAEVQKSRVVSQGLLMRSTHLIRFMQRILE